MCFLTTVGKSSNPLGINFLKCDNVTFYIKILYKTHVEIFRDEMSKLTFKRFQQEKINVCVCVRERKCVLKESE